ncbi:MULTISPECIES: hypothetical protein [unclassified Paenibacillus]|uniref:hypothetical protein n=1 Tax=unclassified Paenibacillus TaxID=185978 RepID=UPI0008B962A7|nr:MULTISPECIES: hypothetical protein [unclassified Paenibacillus]QLG39355.1 hypothetical protein HW560_15490 [Paenibacillus sp. E222]SEO12826.1 hypothetical protein SAMN05518670_3704 [Paenibacillus sp. OK076]
MNGASAVGFAGILTIFIFIGLVGLILYAVFSMAIKRSGLRGEISGLKQEVRLLKEKMEKNDHNFD